MAATSEADSAVKNSTLLSKRYLVPVFLALAVSILNQTTGINSILRYSEFLLTDSGLGSVEVSQFLNIMFPLFMTLVVFIIVFLIDSVGRRILLCVSTGGVAVSLIVLGIIFSLEPSFLKVVILTIAIFCFGGFFSIGCGVVAWLVITELVPVRIRAKTVGVCIFINILTTYIVSLTFPIISNYLGNEGWFFILALFTILYFLIARYAIPETKLKTLEEIEEYWMNKYAQKL